LGDFCFGYKDSIFESYFNRFNGYILAKEENKLKENFINRYKISKSFEDYHNDKLNKIIENKIIEKALSDVDLSKINKLRIAKEYSVIISLYEKRIDILKKLCLEDCYYFKLFYRQKHSSVFK
jgi:signal transduction histidine kinase